MLIFDIFVSMWLNECDGCVTLQDPNLVTTKSTNAVPKVAEITYLRI